MRKIFLLLSIATLAFCGIIFSSCWLNALNCNGADSADVASGCVSGCVKCNTACNALNSPSSREYTVIFDANGGYMSDAYGQPVTTITKYVKTLNDYDVGYLPEPKKSSDEQYVYTFSGWFRDAELTTPVEGNAKLTGDCTVYAGYTSSPTYTYNYYEKDGGYYVKCNAKDLTEVVIPAYYEGLPVVGLPPNAFPSGNSIKSITLPSTLNYINDHALEGCALETLYIGGNVQIIGRYSAACSPKNLYFGGSAADWCNIKNPADCRILYNVENFYIDNARVSDFVVPEGVTELQLQTFSYASCFDRIIMASTVEKIGYVAIDQIRYSPFEYCTADIFWTNDNSRMTALPKCSFRLWMGKNIYLPYTITSVGERCFEYCEELTDVYGGNIQTVEDFAFSDCKNLLNAGVWDNLTEVGASAFEDCKALAAPPFGKNIVYVHENAFKNCAAMAGEIDCANLTLIDNGAFENCAAITAVDIPGGVTQVGDGAFRGCAGVLTLTFTGGGELGEEAFKGLTSLTSLDIGNATYAGKNCFADCTALKEVTAVNPAFTAEYTAFTGEAQLNSVQACGGALTALGAIPIETLYVTSGEIPADALRENRPVAKDGDGNETPYPQTVRLGEQVTAVGDRAFYESNVSLVTVDGENITLGKSCFYKCDKLKSFPFGKLTQIPEYCFSLSAIEGNLDLGALPVGACAFEGCKLSAVKLNCQNVGREAFKNCDKIYEIIVGDSVTSIGIRAFEGCNNVSDIYIGSSVKTINSGAFSLKKSSTQSGAYLYFNAANCTKIAADGAGETSAWGENLSDKNKYKINIGEVYFGENVTSLPSNAFADCRIETIQINIGLTKFGKNAFRPLSVVTAWLTYEGTETEWKNMNSDKALVDAGFNDATIFKKLVCPKQEDYNKKPVQFSSRINYTTF